MDGFCANVYQSEDYYDYIIETPENVEALEMVYQGSCIERFTDKYVFIHLHKDYVNPVVNVPGDIRLSNIDRFGYSAIPKVFGLMDTSSIEATGALRIHEQPVLNLRGQGVIIGFLDTGIDYTLPIFRNEDGTSRILGLWDQTLAQGQENESDEFSSTFPYGAFYTQAQINYALNQEDPYSYVPSYDENGHGTFLAGIAAGKADIRGDFIGMAPDCAIAVVKCKTAKKYLRDFFFVPENVPVYSEMDLMNAIRYLNMLSRSYKRPLIICFGMGTNQGGHDGEMPIANYMSRLSDTPGVAVVIAAGNEGNARKHYYGTVGEGVSDVVELEVGKQVPGFTVELWGNSLNSYYVGIQAPSGERYAPVPPSINEVRRLDFLLEGTRVYVYDRIVKMQSRDYLVFLRFEAPSPGIWKIEVGGSGDYQRDFHMWLPISPFLGEDTFFLKSNPYTTLTSSACSVKAIIVGMYQHKNESLIAEASKGYTRTEVVKPDVLAPGVDIYGPVPGGGYTIKTGSSIAAAHGAGAAALVMEFGAVRGNFTYMDGVQINGLFHRGAKQKRNLSYPNRDWGYGALDVYQVFQTLIGQR